VKYRREIDGLRAVAVLPVMLFHAGFQAFSGGFVGVDVFFVISGYLITTIILTDMERGTFSLVTFYERRTRRILPALFAVMLACLPFAWLWFLPAEMKGFSQSLIAVSTFSSNILFWKTSDYWEITGELIPLLHTWSLAVEEQYYLIFPLFLMLMWRFRKRWILTSFMFVAAISLLFAQWGAYHHPTATFYLLVTRGWELAIGASIAFYFLYGKKSMPTVLSHRVVGEAFSMIGLVLIAYAVVAFDETVPFPSLYALIPTAGTGLIIVFSSSRTLIGRCLGVRPLVWIGLISYSAYLWHQPLFAFARYRSLTTPDSLLYCFLILLSIGLAFLSWKFVERPFRNKGQISRKAVFSFAAVGSVAFAAVGLAGQVSEGWPGRIDGNLLSSIEHAQLQPPAETSCLVTGSGDETPEGSCLLVRSENTFAYLIGDSHAAAIANEMQNAFEKTNVGLIAATERGCPPVENVYVYVEDKSRCFNHNEAVYGRLAGDPAIEYIVIVARWALYMEATRFNNGEGGIEHHEILHVDMALDENQAEQPRQPYRTYLSRAYADSVRRLVALGKKVILVYPIPEAGWDVPRYIRNYHLRNPGDAYAVRTGSTSYPVFRRRNQSAYAALDSIGDYPNLLRVYPEKVFCDSHLKQRCIVQQDGRLLYRDDDHLSNTGAALVIREIMNHVDNDVSS